MPSTTPYVKIRHDIPASECVSIAINLVYNGLNVENLTAERIYSETERVLRESGVFGLNKLNDDFTASSDLVNSCALMCDNLQLGDRTYHIQFHVDSMIVREAILVALKGSFAVEQQSGKVPSYLNFVDVSPILMESLSNNTIIGSLITKFKNIGQNEEHPFVTEIYELDKIDQQYINHLVSQRIKTMDYSILPRA